MVNLLAFLSLIPALVKSILELEALLPQTGVGKAKLEIVNAMVDSSYQNLPDIPVAQSKVLAIIGGFASRTVDILKSIGYFKSSTT